MCVFALEKRDWEKWMVGVRDRGGERKRERLRVHMCESEREKELCRL